MEKVLETVLRKIPLIALQFECNLEFTKDLDYNLCLPNIC